MTDDDDFIVGGVPTDTENKWLDHFDELEVRGEELIVNAWDKLTCSSSDLI